ncbi:hypothetical protein TSH100_17055 [Azospirillum sp. TSH100]|nr:hypothetical protein TSH100_17055 [Azospirillum sp. TSH100]
MFIDIEYSRFVVADLTGLNANVFYELGMRHRARSTGTALFRQVGQPIPFDVQQTRAFPYAYNPQEEAQKSRELITRVVTESLVHSPLDSPIWQVLQQQRAGGLAEESLRLAEEALRARDLPNAERRLIAAAAADPSNVLTHMKLGLLYRDLGEWENARDSFDQVLRMLPNYPEALREKGIAENKIHGKTKVGPDGEASLRAALAKAPHDFDAAASLGGILKRRGDYAGAAGQYELATDLSRGHPYPLLNMIACRARRDGRLDLAPFQTSIEHAEAVLRPQVESGYDSPWSFFDLAEICLLTNREAEGIALIRQAQMQPGTVGWQLKTFRETLQLIAEVSDLDSLNNAIAVLPQED